MKYTPESFIGSPRFIEVATEQAIITVARVNGQTVELTAQALLMGVPNVVKAVAALVAAGAKHCAAKANAGRMFTRGQS